MFALILIVLVGLVIAGGVLTFVNSKTDDTRTGAVAITGAASLVLVVLLALFCHTMIQNQHVGYVKVFGVVQPGRVLKPGFQLKAPWEVVEQVSTAVDTMTFSGSKNEYAILEGLTEDQILITVDMAISWKAVGENVPLFKRTFGVNGNYESNVYSIVRSAVRDTIAQTKWKEGAILNRAAFAERIKRNVEAKTATFFREAGIGPEAARMVEYGAVNLRKVEPPEQVKRANNDLAAADIQVQLQDRLLQVEQSREAVRQAQATNFNALVRVPAGMNPRDYAAVLSATTEQMNAETVRDALENGKQVNVVVGMGVNPVPTAPLAR